MENDLEKLIEQHLVIVVRMTDGSETSIAATLPRVPCQGELLWVRVDDGQIAKHISSIVRLVKWQMAAVPPPVEQAGNVIWPREFDDEAEPYVGRHLLVEVICEEVAVT